MIYVHCLRLVSKKINEPRIVFSLKSDYKKLRQKKERIFRLRITDFKALRRLRFELKIDVLNFQASFTKSMYSNAPIFYLMTSSH